MLGKLLKALSGGKWDFVWAQQWFTMTDQLNMGVRRLMFDPVYFWGAMRLCHCGATFKWFDDVLHFIEKVGERFLEIFWRFSPWRGSPDCLVGLLGTSSIKLTPPRPTVHIVKFCISTREEVVEGTQGVLRVFYLSRH